VVYGNLGELLKWQGKLGPALAADVYFRADEAFLLSVRGVALLEAGDFDASARDLKGEEHVAARISEGRPAERQAVWLARAGVGGLRG